MFDRAEPAERNAEAGGSVPDRLVSTAIAMYGQRGCHAVSARQIQREAGVLNEAAVRYYFGNKQGLLDACVARIAQWHGPLADEAWAEVDAIEAEGRLKVSHVVTALVLSLHGLLQRHERAVWLLARLIREEGEIGQDLLLRHMGPLIWRMEAQLATLLPHKSARALRLHVFLAINSVVNGMVDQTLLWRLPDTADGERRYTLDEATLAEGFIEYVSAGLQAPSAL